MIRNPYPDAIHPERFLSSKITLDIQLEIYQPFLFFFMEGFPMIDCRNFSYQFTN
jgi:hypothetical protein